MRASTWRGAAERMRTRWGLSHDRLGAYYSVLHDLDDDAVSRAVGLAIRTLVQPPTPDALRRMAVSIASTPPREPTAPARGGEDRAQPPPADVLADGGQRPGGRRWALMAAGAAVLIGAGVGIGFLAGGGGGTIRPVPSQAASAPARATPEAQSPPAGPELGPLRTLALLPSFLDADPSDPLDACFGPGLRGGNPASLTYRGVRYEQDGVQCGIEATGPRGASGTMRFYPDLAPGSVVRRVRGVFVVDESSDGQEGARVRWVVRQGQRVICAAHAREHHPGSCRMRRPRFVLGTGPIVIEQHVAAAGDRPLWAGIHHPGLTVRPAASGRTIADAGRPDDAERAEWERAQAQLPGLVVLRPDATLGLRLTAIRTERPDDCGAVTDELVATYRGPRGTMTIFEGEPYFCGNLGELGGTEARRSIRGGLGYVFNGEAIRAVTWKDPTGGGIQVVSGGGGTEGGLEFSTDELLRVAYSMAEVSPAADTAPLPEPTDTEPQPAPETTPAPAEPPAADADLPPMDETLGRVGYGDERILITVRAHVRVARHGLRILQAALGMADPTDQLEAKQAAGGLFLGMMAVAAKLEGQAETQCAENIRLEDAALQTLLVQSDSLVTPFVQEQALDYLRAATGQLTRLEDLLAAGCP